jgi:virulence-associated protein VagC
MTKIAKLFRNGNSQAVRLPQDMRFKGDRVRVRKVRRYGYLGARHHQR